MDDSEELSKVPDLSKWFSSYVYESPMLDTSDGFEFSFPEESKGIKDMELVSSQVKDKSESQVAFLENTEVVEDSEIEEENSSSIWRKPKRKYSRIWGKPMRKKETTTITYEAELNSLRNRVQYLENEVRILYDLINRFQVLQLQK
ncbi:hypothetical protein ISN45_Aa01g011150 [Arabidopsis thaliana x Arabidopsis arenosa]|uniref:Uncharacterized protein n=1 Tax=Arabidopsis thaliana x Arabidopsis arenosa TaxID=1240361 RepID=A0A8T2BZ17_9BRAS|nr:hypothetical protein ISN45_Aa01g011150 [Arabidopsis thaliana x Arabidopsis arenosa]KAG7592192.1 hypothetical protein ISN45_Aa01g011150 [Arabidopsis thaliana x Arabidopsis arenosa]KAG7592193.1 hypothetical protein ISN45_Aa01g011150 [Arabidopsis thaliana x Arabidopsis arenosa]KAG7592194.1 hypothetical protein ISN45_Aa01g011150 [Arabidopsis thaliana x Arabidopsis arenosa]KAG7592195.1 hypothetical protein ISN45_Aa01g011150 [Arabidopsis thaliana x Arabidopsis arenosa]